MLRKWSRVGLIVAIVVLWEARPLSSIGLRAPRRHDLSYGFGTLVALLALNSLLQFALSAVGIEVQAGEGIREMSEMPLLMNATVALTAGVTEEVLYRGAAIERLEEVTGSMTIAAVLPALVFVGAPSPSLGMGKRPRPARLYWRIHRGLPVHETPRPGHHRSRPPR